MVAVVLMKRRAEPLFKAESSLMIPLNMHTYASGCSCVSEYCQEGQMAQYTSIFDTVHPASQLDLLDTQAWEFSASSALLFAFTTCNVAEGVHLQGTYPPC